ncbi:MAG: hypothetical protein LC623_06470 [Halobacteriales archaeon]|nr:hypothetical protein [Halobacteriales archaeon]
MADGTAGEAKAGRPWRVNLVGGLILIAVGLYDLAGGVRHNSTLAPPYSYVLGGGSILLGALLALGLLDWLRPRRA